MTDTPRRIQRRRVKGWRMPPNTVYVGRPSKWGNPFRRREVGMYEVALRYQRLRKISKADVRRELRGKNLACWCPLDQPCHADVLLEIANGPAG